MSLRFIQGTLVAATLFGALPSTAAPAIWTEHNDNNRTGANLSETALAPTNVTSASFGALFHQTLDDQSYSQPLYVPGLTMSDGKVHNVVFVTSVNNSVYAFDADTANGGVALWHVSLTPSGGRPPNRSDFAAMGACGGGYADFSGNVGIVGTPVIDTSTSTLYVIARDITSGAWSQRLHALDCKSGAEKFGGPVVISGSNAGTNFSASLNNQRTALALVNGVVYAGWSSQCDYGAYHGYVIGYNASNLARVAAWSSTNSSGGQAGIWQGGQGPTADASNNLYLMTGNGSWDGAGNYGESFVKLAGGSLTLQDYFTPSNYASLNGGDTDLGSAGALLIPGTSLIFGGGKQGMVYLLNSANMGHEHATDSVVQEFQATFPTAGNTGHIHGSPVYFNNGASKYVYLWGENDFCRAFTFNGSTFNSTTAAASTMRAPVSNTGMPGGFLSISANGTSNGIVWALTPYNANANNAVVAGILHAFNATPSGSTLTELWNSKQNPSRDDFGNFAKFTYPTVANGKVYLSTFGTASTGTGALWVYGPSSGPYGGTAAAIPGTIQFENFDLGGEGLAYHDTDSTNNGGQYRTGEGVDIETCTDTGGGYDVGWTQTGEWMKYSVNVATAGAYTLACRVASGIGSGTAGTFHIENESGTNLTGSITVSATGGWQTWANVNATVNLTAGAHTLKVVIDSGAGAFNLNSMTFTSTAYAGTPYTGTPISIPGTVQVENFDKGGEGVAYHDTDAANNGGQYRTTEGVDIETSTDTGGGYDVGWTQTGEWEKYTVNVSTAKTYTVTFRLASGYPSGQNVGQIHLEDKNGTNLTGAINVIATGGWQTWTTVTASATLPAGSNVLKLAIDNGSGAFNINYVGLN